MSDQSLRKLALATHPVARHQAVATQSLRAGETVITVPAWSTALLPDAKGQRCDLCHRTSSDSLSLRKCTGCAAYWYCGQKCQTAQWKLHHRRICKLYNRFIISPDYMALDPYQRTDAMLLSHLLGDAQTTSASALVELHGKGTLDIATLARAPLSTFLDLLPAPRQTAPPPSAVSSPSHAPALAGDLSARFENNNFLLHSHLNPAYAHGAFPLASRTLNHSCVPNAAPKFALKEGEMPTMVVVAIKDIKAGEEVTIPYQDPAVPCADRRAVLAQNYGFDCTCALCTWELQRGLDDAAKAPAPSGTPEGLKTLGSALRAFAFGQAGPAAPDADLVRPTPMFSALPDALLPVLHPTYLPALSEAFSRASHEGAHADALEVGTALLALYYVVYPRNFPLVGMHALELCKVTWNASVAVSSGTDEIGDDELFMLGQTAKFYEIAGHNLTGYGAEGDEDGPLEELFTMEKLIAG